MATAGVRFKSPLVVIVGPTASGKTAAAIEFAERYNGEVICADSRTIYKGMDVGTAKPTAEEQARVPHWGIDLVEPDQAFTVADFQAYTKRKIREIQSRGNIPLLVGGSGLYVDSVLFNFTFNTTKTWRQALRPSTIVTGIAIEKSVLRSRIRKRAEQLLSNGVVEEATILGKKYSWEIPAMTGNIYPLIHLYINGQISKKELVDKFTTIDWKLAKRQMTWFRPNPYIEWCSPKELTTNIAHRLAPE